MSPDDKAVSLADKTSDGEKLFILANEAGANGDVVKQKAALDKLVAEYPNDERARFNLGNYYFAAQDFDLAIEQYKKATELAIHPPTTFSAMPTASKVITQTLRRPSQNTSH